MGEPLECPCGTFAIGRCARCRGATCGIHSSLVGGLRLCGACQEHDRQEAAVAAAKVAAREAELASERRRTYEATLAEYYAGVRQTLAGDVPPARICRVMRLATANSRGDRDPVVDGGLVVRLLPELFGVDVYRPETPPWADVDVARWFATAATSPPSNRVDVYPGRRRKRPKHMRAWVFQYGSTQRWQSPESSSSHRPISVGISEHGTRLWALASDWTDTEPDHLLSTRFVGSDRFNAQALTQMAILAALLPLPEPPRPPR